MRVLCDAKRDTDPEGKPRWTGWVEVTRREGSKLWFEPPPISELRRGIKGRPPGHFWHFKLYPETLRP